MKMDQFDQTAVDTSSEEIERGLEYIVAEVDELEPFTAPYSIIPYVLDQFGREPSTEFLNDWWDDDIGVQAYENPVELVLTLKLLNKYEERVDEKSLQAVERATSILKSEQSVEGDFAVSAGQAGMPLWVLTNTDPNCDAVQRTIDYLSQHSYRSEYSLDRHDAAAAILALSELGYDKYKETMQRVEGYLTDAIGNHWDDLVQRPRLNSWIETMALSRLEQQPLLTDIVNDLKANQEQDGSWDQSVPKTAVAIQSLIAAGHGPKISKYDAEWEIQKQEQKYEQAVPHLVRTVPIDPTASYHAEIQTRAEKLIKSASDVLRINSLYIDMLYEIIIDKQIANPDLDIRILTRGRDVSGNRKRIKKDVLNELIEATEGSVRGHNRVHSRMVVSDLEAVMISSADLTRDQLRDEFNAGILAHDETTVEKSARYFDNIWEEAERVEHR